MVLKNFNEKTFISQYLSKYASTASYCEFDDCVCIDLEKRLGIKDAPFLVYSIDHPSFIKKKYLNIQDQYRFYGRWAAACTCGDVLAMGTKPLGFSLDLSSPMDIDVKYIVSYFYFS